MNVKVLKIMWCILCAAHPISFQKTIEYKLYGSKNVLAMITLNLGRNSMRAMAGSLPSTS